MTTNNSSTTMQVLDAPTWASISSQQDLDALRAISDKRLKLAGFALWAAPVLGGLLATWLSWQLFIPHAGHSPLLNALMVAGGTIFAIFCAVVAFSVVERVHAHVEASRGALDPIELHQAQLVLQWCETSEPIDSYRLHVIADARRELCVGDYTAIAIFREAEEDRQQQFERETSAKRALSKLATPAPVWLASADERKSLHTLSATH